MVHEDTYHVNTDESYHIQKRSEDAIPRSNGGPSNSGPRLIIYRDSDLYARPNILSRRKRGMAQEESSSSCGTDQLMKKSQGNDGQGVLYSEDDYYHPPNLTTTLPAAGSLHSPTLGRGLDLSSSWTDLIKHGPLIQKRSVALKVAGPNPVPDGCPVNRLVNYMVSIHDGL